MVQRGNQLALSTQAQKYGLALRGVLLLLVVVRVDDDDDDRYFFFLCLFFHFQDSLAHMQRCRIQGQVRA